MDCTVDDIVTLFTFNAADGLMEEQKETDYTVNGVFNRLNEEDEDQLSQIDEWKSKIIEWIRSEHVDGRKMKVESLQNLALKMKDALTSDEAVDQSVLTASCSSILKICRRSPVHRILSMAKRMEMCSLWRYSGRIAGILGISMIGHLELVRKRISRRREVMLELIADGVFSFSL